MNDSLIICPNCKQSIPLTSAIEAPIAQRLHEQFENANREKELLLAQQQKALAAQKQQFEADCAKREQSLAARLAADKTRLEADARKKAQAQIAVDLTDLKNQLAEQAKALAAAQASELSLRKSQRDLEAQKESLAKSFDEQLAQKLAAEGQKIADEAATRAKAAQLTELTDLQSRLAEKDAKLAQAQQLELALRKQQRELQEKQQSLDLELARKLDAERDAIRLAALKSADEAHRLKLAEKDKQLSDAQRHAEDLQRKLEQGSQQAQGEVLELELERLLRESFPHDEIIPVPKGVHGGDVIHRVKTPSLQYCGTILWESKRTRNWGNDWVDKLKGDQRTCKADLAVIVSITLPRDINHMGNIDGVWITSRECMIGMVAALRSGLLRLAETRRAAEGKHEKMEVLYQYLSGHEFKHRIEAIVEAFLSLREDLEQEKRAMTKIWAKREKQLERVMSSTTGLHGDLAAIIGRALPPIEPLELPAESTSPAKQTAAL